MDIDHFRFSTMSNIRKLSAFRIVWLLVFSSYLCSADADEEFLFPCGPRDCAEVKQCWLPNLQVALVYSLTINVPKLEAGASGTDILCHIDGEGTPWTILLLRGPKGPFVNFDRNWTEYEFGFGTIHNFWLGLKRINRMTSSRLNVIKQDNALIPEATFFCDRFSVEDAANNYTLRLGNCIGRDRISASRGAPFGTPDHDSSAGNCAKARRGGWWYNTCGNTNLNGDIGAGNMTGLLWGGDKLAFAQVEFREEQPKYSCDQTCPNGGSCRVVHNRTNSYFCKCAPGYTGWRCEKYDCLMSPCQYNGTCTDTGSCHCHPSYTGNR